MTFNEILLQERKRRGLSQEELAGGYEGYSVSVSVTDGRITRSIPVANNLNFSPGNASWSPTT